MSYFEAKYYPHYRQPHFKSRWLRPSHWQAFINDLNPDNNRLRAEVIGRSFLGRDITAWRWGEGKIKLLLWSQMHGNEPTATMALADLMSFLCQEGGESGDLRRRLEQNLQLIMVPMLNPDGAEQFSRYNAQGVDINRDALRQHTPEMQALMELVRNFEPHYCFNLHDQRNIFAAGDQPLPATISFLAASATPEREITPVRKQAMDLIVCMNEVVQRELPGQCGRYSDEFYPRALGDNFHRMGTPCVLIESGAAMNDPLRDEARRLNFLCLLEVMGYLCERTEVSTEAIQRYQAIPENRELYYDVVYRQATLRYRGYEQITDLALLVEEHPDEETNELVNHYIIKEIGDLSYHYGLKELRNTLLEFSDRPHPNKVADFTVSDINRELHRYKQGRYDEEH